MNKCDAFGVDRTEETENSSDGVPRPQAAMPRGLLGRLMGHVMAVLNSDMERRAVDLLTLRSGDQLLAIGFGPGVGVTHAANEIHDRGVAGVDPSPVMLAQAQRRVRRASRTADLRLGTASQLPWPDRSFHAVVSANNVQFWNLPEDLQEVHRVLAAQGRFAIAVHASMLARRLGASSPQDASERLATIVSDAGFLITRSEVEQARTGLAIYVLAAVPDPAPH